MKKVLCAVLAAALVCGFCGCGKKEESSAQTNTPQSEQNRVMQIASQPTSTETTVNETQMGSFDWDKALSELYIGDVKIEYPFSESSLGDNFIFKIDKARYTSDVENSYLTVVVDYKDYSGLWLFEAQYMGITKETYTPDLVPDKIYSIDRPIVQGIKEGTSMEDVYALWGKPDETEQTVVSSDRTKVIYYGKEAGQKLYLRYNNETNKVESIEIEFTNLDE